MEDASDTFTLQSWKREFFLSRLCLLSDSTEYLSWSRFGTHSHNKLAGGCILSSLIQQTGVILKKKSWAVDLTQIFTPDFYHLFHLLLPHQHFIVFRSWIHRFLLFFFTRAARTRANDTINTNAGSQIHSTWARMRVEWRSPRASSTATS